MKADVLLVWLCGLSLSGAAAEHEVAVGPPPTVINFNNRAPGVNAPIWNARGLARLAGSSYKAQLYVRMPGAAALTASPNSASFRTDSFAGYLAVPADNPVSLGLLTPGSVVEVQIRVWDLRSGPSYETALANRGPTGKSKIISITAGLAAVGLHAGSPTPLLGLASFGLLDTVSLSRGVPTTTDSSNPAPNGEIDAGNSSCGKSVGIPWWTQMVPAEDGAVVVSTSGSSAGNKKVLEVLSGPLANLTFLACTNDPAGPDCVLRFLATGNTAYFLSVADTNTTVNSFHLTYRLYALQTIDFPPLANRQYDGTPITFELTAKASSSLAVFYTVLSGPGTVAGNQLTLTGVGHVRVRASQDGNANYNPAPNVDRSFEVWPLGVSDPAKCISLEAEHFDYGGGSAVALVNTMPYTGSEYAGQGAVHLKDYYQDTHEPSQLGAYRSDQLRPNVPMALQMVAGTLDVQRPGFEVTTNFRIGWVGSGEWFNYTRTGIPKGVYTAHSANSHGDQNADVGGRLGWVIAGVGTTSQTVKDLGEFRALAPGGWGNNVLGPLLGPDGAPAYFKLPGGKVTLRYTTRNGDFDWFTLAPATGVPPVVVQRPPPLDTIRRDQVRWLIDNLSTAVVLGSIALEVDGTPVTDGLTKTLNPATDDVTVKWVPGGGAPAGIHSYRLSFSDGANTYAYINTMNVGPLPAPGTFLIEAEDFNFNNGQTQPTASIMPYLGGAYDSLAATEGVDYDNDDDNSSDVYRKELDANGENQVNIIDSLGNRWGRDRGAWNVTVNYRIGWMASGDWCNYTRTIPANTYEVWAALSYDSRNANDLRGSLQKVVSDPKVGNQSLQGLGLFRGPGSGGWGQNNLVPLTDAGGAKVTLALGGTTTLRFSADSGDFDYLVLVPVTGVARPWFTSVKIEGANVVMTWAPASATLESSDRVTGGWTAVAGAASGKALPANPPRRFYRLVQ